MAHFTNNRSRYNESLEAFDRALQIDPKNPRTWDLKGLALSEMRRYNESLKAYDKAIENIDGYQGELPANQTEYLSMLLFYKGTNLWQVGRIEESLDAFDRAVSINPEEYDTWIMKGHLLAFLGRYDESLQAFDRAAGIDGSRPEMKASPWVLKGNALLVMGRCEEADETYKNVTELSFSDESAGHYLSNAWRGRGIALAKLGTYNESIEAFNRSIEFDSKEYPRNAPIAWVGIGNGLRDMGRYEEAIQAYDRALEYPQFTSAGIGHAWKGKGDALSRLGRGDDSIQAYDEAVKAYDEVIKAYDDAPALEKALSLTYDPYPLDGEFWYDRGYALWSLDRDPEANSAFEKVRSLGYRAPEHTSPTDSLSITNVTSLGTDEFNELYKNESYQEALNAYEQVLKIDPQNASAWHYRGLALVGMGHGVEANQSIQKAIEFLDQRLQKDPEDIEALWLKAEGMDLLGRSEKALEAYGRVAELNSTHTLGAWIRESDILAALGRYNLSVESFSRVSQDRHISNPSRR
jgi:tetratricopeptide (TPR) repeat protein